MIIRSVTLLATCALWVATTAATAPEPPAAPAVTVTTPGQSYDLTHEDTSDTACWVEKVQSQDTAEAICGARGLRPAGSVDLGTELTIDGKRWVATMGGLEPVGAN